jgi:hypothetical protein
MSTNPPAESSDVVLEATRVLAHQLWENAGCPSGHDLQFWHAAEEQLLEAGAAKPSTSANGASKRRAQPSGKKLEKVR